MHERRARKGAAWPQDIFFSPSPSPSPLSLSPELNGRLADLCRRCFFARVFHYHPIIPSGPLPTRANRKWQASLRCFARRGSARLAVKVLRFSVDGAGDFQAGRTRPECASSKREIERFFVENTQLRGQSVS